MLTEKQKRVLGTIEKYIEEYGYPPTIRKLLELLSLKSTSTMHGHLERLERLGYIQREKDSPRAIKILKKEA